MRSRVCLKLYDFDMATKTPSAHAPQEIVNHGLAARDLCARVGACHRAPSRRYAAPFFDAFTALTLLYEGTRDAPLRAFIERVIDAEWLAQAPDASVVAYPNRACWHQGAGSGSDGVCRPIALADVAGASHQSRRATTRMLTPRAALADKYFNRFLALPAALPAEYYALCSHTERVLAPGPSLFGN